MLSEIKVYENFSIFFKFLIDSWERVVIQKIFPDIEINGIFIEKIMMNETWTVNYSVILLSCIKVFFDSSLD